MAVLMGLQVLLGLRVALPVIAQSAVVGKPVPVPCIFTVKPADWATGNYTRLYREWKQSGFICENWLLRYYNTGTELWTTFDNPGYYHCRSSSQVGYVIVVGNVSEPKELVMPITQMQTLLLAVLGYLTAVAIVKFMRLRHRCIDCCV